MEKRKKNKLAAITKWVLWVLLVQFLLLNISAALYAYKLTHFYTDKQIRKSYDETNVFGKTWRLFSGPRFQKQITGDIPIFQYDTVWLQIKSGLKINAWYAKTDSSSKGTVIMFHGITSNKSVMIPEANEFLYQGYNIMMVDLRAHGNSDGSTTTIGIKESEEVKLAWDWVRQNGENNIFLYGISMGAVVVSKAIKDYSIHPKGVILEMPFGSMKSYLQARARLLGFRGFTQKPFSWLVGFWINVERGLQGFGHQTKKYVRHISCPVLVQWGAEDNIVLKSETEEVYKALTTSDKKLVVYENAGHESLLQKDPSKWQREIEDFFQRADY
ncbi:MAG TPA: alpha/beta hydrolase [Chitinophagaceae bacterium]|nr:alpha/beta hydrolase [Chitinophagaceae bacterium]HRX93441.1 alpha/beta hydrolase [Chitinophagaceae bacterium]